MPAVRILLCGGTEIVVGACDTMGYVTRSDRAHRTLLGNAEAPWYHTHRRRAPSRRTSGPPTTASPRPEGATTGTTTTTSTTNSTTTPQSHPEHNTHLRRTQNIPFPKSINIPPDKHETHE